MDGTIISSIWLFHSIEWQYKENETCFKHLERVNLKVKYDKNLCSLSC